MPWEAHADEGPKDLEFPLQMVASPSRDWLVALPDGTYLAIIHIHISPFGIGSHAAAETVQMDDELRQWLRDQDDHAFDCMAYVVYTLPTITAPDSVPAELLGGGKNG